VLQVPWSLTKRSLLHWFAVAVVFAVLAAVLGAPAAAVMRIAIAIVSGGLITSALGFLLFERAFRPLIARALADAPLSGDRAGRGLSVSLRLLIAWVLGSAIPVYGILLLLAAPEGVSVNLRVSVAFLSVLVIVVGGLLIWVAATSVAEPLQSLRESLTEVEQGHLDVAVPVNDAGEVGRLQSGFNQMVTGLRERRHLEDLFGRHVGAEVARFALDEEAGLHAQMREASALFVDMIGSTALSARIPPAETVAMLNDLFDVTVRVVTDCGGWVNKFEGDGALCVFGTPGQQADHADRVLAAARALRGEVVALQDRWPALDTGIGVSSGRVLAGNVGAEERYEYTVIGDPVNEAARLTDEAKRFDARVLASEASIRAAGEDEAAHWEVVGEIALRGRDQPTCAYRPKDAVRSSAGSAR
jgi:adenylate cyclase